MGKLISYRWMVITPFVAAVMLLCFTGAAVVDLLSAGRAYISGESLYSKGQKDAVYHLWRYSQTRDEADFRRFQSSIALPIGDRHAREEMNRPRPDLARVRAGFLQGGNHPADIDGVIRTYRRFRDAPFMARAIEIWVEGDAAIAELDALARRVHENVELGTAGPEEMARLIDGLPELNERLTGLELRFLETLGEANRVVQVLTLSATFGLGLVLIVAGTMITSRLLRSQAMAEEALQASNARWELAAEGAGIGVFDWDLNGGGMALDARAAAICGLGVDASPAVAQSIAAQRLSDHMHLDDQPAFWHAVKQATATGAPLELRFRMRGEAGRERHLELAGKVDSDGVRPRLVGILWDVSADVQRQQLRLEKEAAERASAAKTVFLSRVSHELRTPLNAVLGFAQLLDHDAGDPLSPGQRQRVRHVLDSGNHLLALIDDVLDLTSIDQDAASRELALVDLAEALRVSLMQVEPMAHAHEVKCDIAMPAGHSLVRADARWLRQVLINLLSNAIKYNRRGGRVDVEVTRGATGVVVVIRDSGIGMTGSQVAALFQPFNRLGAEHSKVPGNGLGLVIVRQLINRMGGTLEVASEPGQGTTFTVGFQPETPGGEEAGKVETGAGAVAPTALASTRE